MWIRTRTSGGGPFSAWREVYHTGNNTPALGVGQTWQDVTASRSPGTTYTNTTGRSIQLMILVADSGSDGITFTINGITLSRGNLPNQGADYISLIIPSGSTYRLVVGSNSITKWLELR
jgi:hypothetical protein